MIPKTNFNESQTKINLMRAFAGECQARQRYYQGALAAQKQFLVVDISSLCETVYTPRYRKKLKKKKPRRIL